MKPGQKDYTIEFITPCFCAGAKQSAAELRASEIRGQLRWWYRAIGGSREDETEIFGGIEGGAAKASKIVIRASHNPKAGEQNWHQRIPKQGFGSLTYLLGFFFRGTDRLQAGGALPPGSKGTVQVVSRISISDEFDLALRAFLTLGSLGFRSTRCAGSFECKEQPATGKTFEEISEKLRDRGFQVELLDREHRDWISVCMEAGDILKSELRGREGLGISAGKNGTRPNPLGSAVPRQASVVRFRPLRIDGKLRLALLEAPHERVLGQGAMQAWRRNGSIIAEFRRRREMIA